MIITMKNAETTSYSESQQKNVRHGFCIIKTSILFELVTKKE